jgi:hypothetical protein
VGSPGRHDVAGFDSRLRGQPLSDGRREDNSVGDR